MKEQYFKLCTDYVAKFCIHTQLTFKRWGHEVGGLALFGDENGNTLTFQFSDIVYRLNNDLPPALIVEWHYNKDLPYPIYAQQFKQDGTI